MFNVHINIYVSEYVFVCSCKNAHLSQVIVKQTGTIFCNEIGFIKVLHEINLVTVTSCQITELIYS